METPENETALTFAQLMHLVARHIVLVLAATIVLTAAAVLLFYFLINPMTARYSMEFSLSYPASASLKYPDGTPFYYQDMISLSALETAKGTDARFSSLNVEEMLDEDMISLEKISEEGKEAYRLTVSGSCIRDRALGTAFLRAVANLPVSTAKEMASRMDYHINEEVFENASFADRLALLSEQKESLVKQYDEWIALYRESYAVAGKTLKNYRAEVNVIFGAETRARLADELASKGYVSVEHIGERIAELSREKVDNEKKIAALREALSYLPMTAAETIANEPARSASEMIAALIARNVEIDSEIAALTEEDVRAFEALIDREYSNLGTAANTIRSVATALYEQESRADFATARAEKEGGVNIYLVAVGGAILFFVLSCIVVCTASRRKKKVAE